MDFVTDTIAIGNHLDGADEHLLATHAITGILCLAGDRLRIPPPPGVEKDGWPLLDGRGNHLSDIDGALRKLDRLLARHARVLVHCNAGRSRSCGLVALWIARREKVLLAVALSRVAERRPVMWITPDFLETLEMALGAGS